MTPTIAQLHCFYSTHDIHLAYTHASKILERGPTYRGAGVCYNLKGVPGHLLSMLFKTWPHALEQYQSPIESFTEYKRHPLKFDCWAGDLGALRYDLCRHIVAMLRDYVEQYCYD